MKAYEAAGHAIQSGVKIELSNETTSGEVDLDHIKHLRVGLDLRACDHAALVRLLIQKGILTEEEYVNEITAEANAEVARYEARLTKIFDRKITLG